MVPESVLPALVALEGAVQEEVDHSLPVPDQIVDSEEEEEVEVVVQDVEKVGELVALELVSGPVSEVVVGEEDLLSPEAVSEELEVPS